MPDDPIMESARRSIAKRMDRMIAEVFMPKGSVYTSFTAPTDDSGLTVEKVLAVAKTLSRPAPLEESAAFQPSPYPWGWPGYSGVSFAGMQFEVKDAQEQCRTPRDVRGPWVQPGRVPSKRDGRKGTRRTWKRAHPPGYVWYYREPEDILVFNGRSAWVTPRQWDAIKREASAAP